jgi:FAD/FMN-containing dehydrogenase
MTTSTRPQQGLLEPLAVDGLATTLRGELISPGDPSYERHRRVWNGSIDRRPGLIARCAGIADVRSAIRFAREQGLLVAVRGGGHSFPGYSVCDDGMVIDLSMMKGIRVDPDARTARVQAGALLGELDRKTQEFGLAVTAGIVTHTGVAGLTLGGGIGWLQRKHGLTIDNLLSVDVVTADGEFVTASQSRNADLFWGLRGGGGNFGIATEFEFRLHAVGPEVLAGPVFWAMEDAPEVLRF